MVVATRDAGPRSVTVLGSTGSVGRSTLDLVGRYRDRYVVEALTGGRNVAALIEQARLFRPKLAVIADPDRYADLKDGLAGTGVEVAAGAEAVVVAAERPAEWVMAAIVGAAGLEPTLAAARRGAVVALANKECLVCAGPLMMDLVTRSGALLLPVDSEHNAIFQVFDAKRPETVAKLILTASGGPFRTWDAERMRKATPEEAVAHPTWSMGTKISIDSATMMNKGLEIIEAHFLFGLPEERIEVLVHPQSVVHSLVAYVDGSVLAQLGSPDMRIPIASALAWPDRIATPAAPLDLAHVAGLSFEAPDARRFPALGLARRALQCGGAVPTILNAANEVAVQGFLDRRIGFLDIARLVEETMDALPGQPLGHLDDVRHIDAEARRRAGELMNRWA